MAIRFRERQIDDFKGKLVGGGARPNLFEVEFSLPENITSIGSVQQVEEKMRFMVKAAQLPASNVSAINVPFRGRILKVAGDRSFDTWTVTVINDTDFSIRSALERWMNSINKHEDDSGLIDPTSYQRDAFIYQLGRAPTKGDQNASMPILRKYKFHGIFPTQITAIDLSYDSTDTIEEFQVEFQVQWWESFRQSDGGSEANTNDLTN